MTACFRHHSCWRRLILYKLMIVMAGCSSEPLDAEKAKVNLMAQAEDVRQAVLHEDHEKMADLTHPVLIRNMGGRDAFVRHLEEIAAEIRDAGWRFEEVSVTDVSELAEKSGRVYAIVSLENEMIMMPWRLRRASGSYLVAVSEDGGDTWRFIGSGGGDRQEIKRLLPDFPEGLELPSIQEPQWGPRQRRRE